MSLESGGGSSYNEGPLIFGPIRYIAGGHLLSVFWLGQSQILFSFSNARLHY